MDLQNGEIHESGVSDTKLYRKLNFTNHRIAMDAQQFSFQQSGPGVSRSDRELSAPDMMAIVDSLNKTRLQYFTGFQKTVNKYFLGDSSAKPITESTRQDYARNDSYPNYVIGNNNRAITPANSKQNYSADSNGISQSSSTAIMKQIQVSRQQERIRNENYTNLIERIKNIKNEVLSSFLQADFVDKEIDKYMVEIHKKYSIPAACIIFILLGAPLGVITRKGGFGMAASVSLFFFLIYWASLIGGEKLADRGLMTPFWGMWSANILMGLVGILLTKKVANETVTLDFSFFKKLIPKVWQQPEDTSV